MAISSVQLFEISMCPASVSLGIGRMAHGQEALLGKHVMELPGNAKSRYYRIQKPILGRELDVKSRVWAPAWSLNCKCQETEHPALPAIATASPISPPSEHNHHLAKKETMPP